MKPSRGTTEKALRQAIARNEFVVLYQPIVSLDTMRTIAVEALLRWQRGDILVGPHEFLPLAEESVLICEIGEWVMAEALQAHAAWHAENIAVSMHVNLSPRQFYDDRLPDHISAAIGRSRGDASALALEITETTTLNSEHARSIMDEIHTEWGIRFGLDDFGAAHAQLAQIMELPLDFVKIDQMFVQRAERRKGPLRDGKHAYDDGQRGFVGDSRGHREIVSHAVVYERAALLE